MESQPVIINININLDQLPKCRCDKGFLLPVMDLSREGIPHLKGWCCNNCGESVLFKSGDICWEARKANTR